MSDKKKEKRKPKYSTFYCIRWLVAKMWKWDKVIIISTIVIIPLAVIMYAFGLYTPSLILESLETANEFQTVVWTIVALLSAQAVFGIIRASITKIRSLAQSRNMHRFNYERLKKYTDDDYYLSLEPEYLKLFQRLSHSIFRGKGAAHIVIGFADIAVNVICFFLFGSVISQLSPWIILLLALGSGLSSVFYRWSLKRDREKVDERARNDKRLGYVSWGLGDDMKAGKDIRLYNMAPFLEEKGNEYVRESIRLLRYSQNNNTVFTFANDFIIALRDGIAYYFLISGVMAGEITSAEFVLYFSAISQMSGFIGNISGYFASLSEVKLNASDCIEYLDGDFCKMNRGKGVPLPQKGALSVEFKNVTYKYPKGEKNILENVSFKIEEGEKISLVGLNGAGKTTLTLLMCGLLLPNEGEVLINGVSVMEYNRDELYTLFSLLPQDSDFLPTTIAENIALCKTEEIDYKRLWNALEKADMAEKIRALPKNVETGMMKQFDESAADFSGGEKQKLLLARVIYRDAPIMILDEPTAALDPIAENEMYLKYRDIAQNATSVFISHRLASARFCDRIYLLDGAKFIECGTHEELMALGGKYRELFDIQSKYYREGGNDDEEKAEEV